MQIIETNTRKHKVARNLEIEKLQGVSYEEKQALIAKYKGVLKLISELGGFITKDRLVRLLQYEKTSAGVSFILSRLCENGILNTYTMSLSTTEQSLYEVSKYVVYTFSRVTREAIDGIAKTPKRPTKRMVIKQGYMVHLLVNAYEKSVKQATKIVFEGLAEELRSKLLFSLYEKQGSKVAFETFAQSFTAYDKLGFQIETSVYEFILKTKSRHTILGFDSLSNYAIKKLDEQGINHRFDDERIIRYCQSEQMKCKQRKINYERVGDSAKSSKMDKMMELLTESYDKTKLYALRKELVYDDLSKRNEVKQYEKKASLKDLEDMNTVIKFMGISERGISIAISLYDNYNRKQSPRSVAMRILNSRFLIEALLEFYDTTKDKRAGVYVKYELYSYRQYNDTYKNKVKDILFALLPYTEADKLSKRIEYVKIE